MATVSDVQKLVFDISVKQEALLKDMNKINSSSSWKAAATRARVASIELTKMYKQYRTYTRELAKNNN